MMPMHLIFWLVGVGLPFGASAEAPGGVAMYASDVLARPGASVALSVEVVEPSAGDVGGRPVAGATVEFFLSAIDDTTFADPVPIGTAESDPKGRATHRWRPRIGSEATGVKRYGIVARLGSESAHFGLATIQVVVTPGDQPILLVKLDAEPAAPSDAVAAAEPLAVTGVKVLGELAELFQPIYLTEIELSRAPQFKAWVQRRLPTGPVLLLSQDPGVSSPEERTAATIRSLLQDGHRRMIGIGANAADARAFAASGLPAIVVPRDLEAVGALPEDALVTSSWTTVYAHLRLCEEGGELQRRLDGGGDAALKAQRALERLGRASAACLD